jgi:anti-sigma regulatory factor (Ser/Thr protein kinase)/CheY-like chemotaxis protein
MRKVLLIGGETEVNRSIAQALSGNGCMFAFAAGGATAIRRLRAQSYDVVITDPLTSIDEDLALLEEMRVIRPGVRTIILAPYTAPEDVIAALRARVFACFGFPFDIASIAEMACLADVDAEWRNDIEVLSAHRDWVSLRVNCRLLTAERLITFMSELRKELPAPSHEELLMAFREILLNAMEHGGGLDPHKVVEVAAVRTGRAVVFYVRDPGPGFGRDSIPHAAVSNPGEDPTAHLAHRAAEGMRPGGFGILLARGIVNELIYSEVGNEVLLIKHLS